VRKRDLQEARNLRELSSEELESIIGGVGVEVGVEPGGGSALSSSGSVIKIAPDGWDDGREDTSWAQFFVENGGEIRPKAQFFILTKPNS
jgi:hypothetical protein